LDDNTEKLANNTFVEIDNTTNVDDRIEKTDLLTSLVNTFKSAMTTLSRQPVGPGPAPLAVASEELVQTDVGKEVGKSVVSGTIKGTVDAANMAKDVSLFTGQVLNPAANQMLQQQFKKNYGINLDNANVTDLVMPIFGLTTKDFEDALKEIEPETTYGQIGSELTAFLVASSLMPSGGTTGATRSFVKGALGDAAITPRVGNLASLAEELGVQNEFVSFMNSYIENPNDVSTFERLKARVKGATTDSVLIGSAFLAATKILASKIGQIGLTGAAVTASTTEEGEAAPLSSIIKLFQSLKPAPVDARAHKVPHQLLVESDGEKPINPVVQAFTPNNKKEVFTAIDQTSNTHPQALQSTENWLMMEKEAFGGQYLPIPPLKAIEYANSPEKMAEKLKNLTPEMKEGVDEGFSYVKDIRDIYASGQSSPIMTADLFVWGILSRGAGPVQQEAAFIDIMQDARPLIEKVVNGTFSEADKIQWENTIKNSLPEGSPGKQVTMNVNAAGKLLFELSKKPQGSDLTVLQSLHNMIADPNVSAKDIRREFMALTEGAGIDNKVVSFTLLVAGRDDVLVMDRIQGRHLWDDGRFGGKNIYDGFKKEGTTISEGLQGIFRGPRGILLTEMLEDGLRPNIQKTYELLGRPEDGTLGRWHWENWVIEGEQVVSHSTLSAITEGSPIGKSVVEGKFNTFSSGARYTQTENGPVVQYPLSDGSSVFMTPTRQKEFEKFIKNAKNGIIPKGFKVTENTERPWYENTEVNRGLLDQAARQFENTNANGEVLRSP
jgi:hypothetical protein